MRRARPPFTSRACVRVGVILAVNAAMALMLHDTERFDDKPPLESVIDRPASFHVYQLLLATQFLTEGVYLPHGLEDASVPVSVEPGAFDAKRPRAPLPAPQSSPNAAGLRPMYSAYMAANFITYYDARITPAQFLPRGSMGGVGKSPRDMVAYSMLAELTDAAKGRQAARNALGRSTETITGPHESQRSRCMAATLLFPRAHSGRTSANKHDITFLDAFALIASATNRPCFSVGTDGMPQTSGASPADATDGDAVRLVDMVRLSVVAGASAVASFAKTLGIASTSLFTSDEWKRNSLICFSYVAGENVVHIPLVIEDGVTSTNVASAVRTIQSAALRGQIQSDGKLVLPHGFVSPDYVDVDDDDTGCNGGRLVESHFLAIQAEKQRAFRRLHLAETVVDVPSDVVRRLDLESNQARPRFVRICSNRASIDRLADESHCPGMLFTSDQRLMTEYLTRNRIQAPPNPWTRKWPAYGLSPPLDEERLANITVLWLRIETHKIGDKLNLFFPRVLMGKEVTDVDSCRVFAVVPTICPVESIVCSGNYVLPCTANSMLPSGHSELASRLSKAFGNAIDESFEHLKGLLSPMPMGNPCDDDMPLRITCLSTPSSAIEDAASLASPGADVVDGAAPGEPGVQSPAPADTGASAASAGSLPSSPSPMPRLSPTDDAFIAALMGVKLGHPASTCGAAYDLLQAHSASEHMYSRSFHSLVAAGVSKLGADVSMQTLMDEAAAALVERLSVRDCYDEPSSESDRKRSRTPHGPLRSPSATLPPPQLTDSLRQDSMASGLSEASTCTTTPMLRPVPLTRQDSLQRYMSDNDHLRRLISIAGLELFHVPEFGGGETWLLFPLDFDNAHELLLFLWNAYGACKQLYNDEMHLELPSETGQETAAERMLVGFQHMYATYYKTLRSSKSGWDVLEDYDTYVLFRTRSFDDALLYFITHGNSDDKAYSVQFHPVTSDTLFAPLQKMGKLLFCVSAKQTDASQTIANSQLTVNISVYRSLPGAAAVAGVR